MPYRGRVSVKNGIGLQFKRVPFLMKTVVIFLNSASFAAAPVFDLPLCTLTDTEGKPESGIYFKISEITQYLMNTLYDKRCSAGGKSS